ncbi:MAG: DEAD/DEAH box helicase family protein, partial [Chloroflexi bacterium]|nr:DEAD/DEAH box helicase family protein [Chloroflexota bacterium]
MELELRAHQVHVLDKLRESMMRNRSVILYGPTGFGKTECAISLMDAVRKKGRRAAMVLDRITLCNQTSDRLQKYHIDHGVLQSGHWRYRPSERLQVCSAQTLEARGSFPGLDLLIVDECHVQRQSTVEFIRNNPSVRVIGLSATPITKGLRNSYSGIVNAVTTRELVDAGWLVPLRVFVAKQIDMSGAKKIAGEWAQNIATERGIQITGDVVSEWVKKTHEIFGGPRKTIVFCAGVAHGADLATKFADAGYNFVSISYKDDDKFKADAIADFARPDTSIHGLIATDILSRGFDVPDVMIGVSARPFSKSLASHIQQMGRVMRPSMGKESAIWLCHSGNYLRHQAEWERIYGEGVADLDDEAEKPKPEPTDKQKEAAKCPQCGALWGNADVCTHCGHVRQRRNDVIDVPGEMQEIGAKKEKYSAEYKADFYAQLLGYCRERGWSPGAAFHRYREKFGV